MRLAFIYMPVTDVERALAVYRDKLGWEEAWREGESTVALRLPGTDVELMIDHSDSGYKSGPVLEVESVAAFRDENDGALRARGEPDEIPGGFFGSFEDPFGNVLHAVDQSGDPAQQPGASE